jgi:hypothetical protein
MKIRKITTGFVVQTFNSEVGNWVNQEFVAGDQVDYEDENGDPVNDKDNPALNQYLTFNMVQPISP